MGLGLELALGLGLGLGPAGHQVLVGVMCEECGAPRERRDAVRRRRNHARAEDLRWG